MHFIHNYRHESKYCSKLLEYAVIISRTNKTGNKYLTTRANVSMVMNEGVNMC